LSFNYKLFPKKNNEKLLYLISFRGEKFINTVN